MGTFVETEKGFGKDLRKPFTLMADKDDRRYILINIAAFDELLCRKSSSQTNTIV